MSFLPRPSCQADVDQLPISGANADGGPLQSFPPVHDASTNWIHAVSTNWIPITVHTAADDWANGVWQSAAIPDRSLAFRAATADGTVPISAVHPASTTNRFPARHPAACSATASFDWSKPFPTDNNVWQQPGSPLRYTLSAHIADQRTSADPSTWVHAGSQYPWAVWSDKFRPDCKCQEPVRANRRNPARYKAKGERRPIDEPVGVEQGSVAVWCYEPSTNWSVAMGVREWETVDWVQPSAYWCIPMGQLERQAIISG